MNRSLFSSMSVDWPTPKEFYKKLNEEFRFNDDPCPLHGKGGLDRSWGKRTYVNPPYGRGVGLWIRKGLFESTFEKTIVFLLPARTDTIWFHKYILPFAREIRFIKGRLKFGEHKNSAPFPSMIVVFQNTSPYSLIG